MNWAFQWGHSVPPEAGVTIVDASPVRPDEADRGPLPPIRLEVQSAVRRQAAQALEPVLADFRERSVHAVRSHREQAPETDRGDGPQDGRPASAPSRQERPPSSRHTRLVGTRDPKALIYGRR
jgi:hypothetical protein